MSQYWTICLLQLYRACSCNCDKKMHSLCHTVNCGRNVVEVKISVFKSVVFNLFSSRQRPMLSVVYFTVPCHPIYQPKNVSYFGFG